MAWGRLRPAPTDSAFEVVALSTELRAIVGEAEILRSLLGAANSRVRTAEVRLAQFVDRLEALQLANEAKDREITDLRALVATEVA